MNDDLLNRQRHLHRGHGSLFSRTLFLFLFKLAVTVVVPTLSSVYVIQNAI